MKSYVGIASIPSRKEGLKDTLISLSPQVEHIYVHLNNYDNVPEDLLIANNISFTVSENIGDVGKMHAVKYIKDEEYYLFLADDDIIYPNDYIQKNIDNYTPGSIQSSHGKIFPSFPIESYNFGDVSGFYFGNLIREKIKIHGIGTGVAMMDSSVATLIEYDKFSVRINMLDTWISSYAMLNKIDMFILPHELGWLKPNPKINQNDSLWEQEKNTRDYELTAIYNHYAMEGLKNV